MSRIPIQDDHREDVARFVEQHWRSRAVMSRGRKFFPHLEQGFVEFHGGKIVGLLTYRIDQEGMEILTLNSTLEGQGIGSSMVVQCIEAARTAGCARIWMTTTNDNMKGLIFWQLLGFRIVAVHVGVVDEARKLKPQIPEVGEGGVPIHDELVLELRLKPYIDSDPHDAPNVKGWKQ